MLKKLTIAASLLALALPTPVQPVDAQQLKTSRQLWKMSRKEAAEQSLNDLTAILSPSGVYPKGVEGVLFRDGVGGTDFRTKPYGTYYPGVCARDVLTLSYAHARTGGKEGNRTAEPVRPYHVSVGQEYAFVRQPAVEMLSDSETGYGSQFRPECANVGPSATWFEVSGEDPRLGTYGWLLFQEALKEIRAGTLKPEKCDTMDEGQGKSCLEVLEAISDYHLLRGVGEYVTPDVHDYHISVQDYSVTISTKTGRPTFDPGSDHNISSITMEPRGIVMD
jgi:hypothetical protein